MSTSPEHDERIAKMTFATVYPHYVNKVERKGRTITELHQVIEWLTGFDEKRLQQLIADKVTFKEFLITGTICGYKIQEITTPLTKQARYMDKLVDELAAGKKMEKILRS
jgi:hypothetical protein